MNRTHYIGVETYYTVQKQIMYTCTWSLFSKQAVIFSFHTSIVKVHTGYLFYIKDLPCVFSIKIQRSSALIFHKWNKNCFLVIFIISNSIVFKWKIVRGMKRSSFLQNVIMIWRKLDPVHKNCTNLLPHSKIKNMNYALKN